MKEPVQLVRPSDPLAAWSESSQSFAEFFEREKTELYGTLCLVTGNPSEAEELTQDAFVRLLEHWERVSRLDDPRGYLYRTAMNAFRSRYRRAVVAARRTFGHPQRDDGEEDVDARDAVVRALATLSVRQRAAVILTDLLCFSSEEAARMLGIRASTVRVHVARAHTALKETMTDG